MGFTGWRLAMAVSKVAIITMLEAAAANGHTALAAEKAKHDDPDDEVRETPTVSPQSSTPPTVRPLTLGI